VNPYIDWYFIFLQFPIYYLIAVGLVAPFAETLGFQMLPIEVSRFFRASVWFMIILSITSFSIVHFFWYKYSLYKAIDVLPAGLILAYSYLRFRQFSFYRAIGVTTLVHGFYNASIYIITWLLLVTFAGDRNVNPVSAKRALKIFGGIFEERAFINYINLDKKEMVDLYITAGMDPNARNKLGWSALTFAVYNNNIHIVNKLLKKGADINAQSDNGWTALTIAVYNGNAQMLHLLIEKGADVNIKSSDGSTVLMRAIWGKHNAMVPILLWKGAEVNAKNRKGWTALMYASYTGDSSIVNLLLEKGADINTKNKDGKTAFLIAKEKGQTNIVKLLKQDGAKE
jgi:hypothetical protein